MALDNTTEIGKIWKFGRYGQASCVVLLAIIAVSGR